MTTIKSFSNLDQSRKLAEILPFSSADMFYSDMLVDGKHQYNYHYLGTHGFKTFEDAKLTESKRLKFIPCWSLAALLNNIPQAKLDSIIQYDKKYWRCCAYFESDWHHSNWTDNPIDACYEMVLKLHELKLL